MTYLELKIIFQQNIMWALSDIIAYQTRQWKKVGTKHTQQDIGNHHSYSNKTLVATKPIQTRPWWPPSMFQQDLIGHQACSNKTLVAIKPIPIRPWRPLGLFQQELGDHKACSKKTLVATTLVQ